MISPTKELGEAQFVNNNVGGQKTAESDSNKAKNQSKSSSLTDNSTDSDSPCTLR